MVMHGRVRIEPGPGGVNIDPAQQTRPGELVQRVVDGCERHPDAVQLRFPCEHLRGHMAVAVREKEADELASLTCQPQSPGSEQFIDAVCAVGL